MKKNEILLQALIISIKDRLTMTERMEKTGIEEMEFARLLNDINLIEKITGKKWEIIKNESIYEIKRKGEKNNDIEEFHKSTE